MRCFSYIGSCRSFGSGFATNSLLLSGLTPQSSNGSNPNNPPNNRLVANGYKARGNVTLLGARTIAQGKGEGIDFNRPGQSAFQALRAAFSKGPDLGAASLAVALGAGATMSGWGN